MKNSSDQGGWYPLKSTEHTREEVSMCAKTWGITEFINNYEGESPK